MLQALEDEVAGFGTIALGLECRAPGRGPALYTRSKRLSRLSLGTLGIDQTPATGTQQAAVPPSAGGSALSLPIRIRLSSCGCVTFASNQDQMFAFKHAA